MARDAALHYLLPHLYPAGLRNPRENATAENLKRGTEDEKGIQNTPDALGAAAKGGRGRGTRGGGSTREEDVRGTLPGPKP